MKTAFWILAAVVLVGCTTSDSHLPSSSGLKVELSDSPLAVKFTNNSTKPIRILRPLDGSEDCWKMPYYKLTVTDDRGRKVPLSGRCGMYGFPYEGTKWPDDYLVTIPAGGSYYRPLRLAHAIPVNGSYTLSFQYIFEPTSSRTPGGRYPRKLWRGEASSNEIKAHLEAVARQ